MECCSAFGIDLGTTNTVACIFKNHLLEVLRSNHGENYYPSVVAFPERGKQAFYVGRAAKNRMRNRPQEAVYNVKRLLGVEYNSRIVKTMKEKCSFNIEDDGHNKPIITYTQNNKKFKKYPQEISALVLSHVAADMKDFAGFDIKDVVITVPAYFNRNQRHLTEDAAKIAGLNVLEIITEPEAAAFAYLDNENLKSERIILLFDLGGGTFDVTIMRISENKFEELALDGNLFLGGSDFDTLIMDAFIAAYEKEMGKPFPHKRLSALRLACEEAKIELMSQLSVDIEFDSFKWTLFRWNMDDLLRDKIKKTLKICDRALRSAGLTKDAVDDVLFVGGSTYLRLVETMVGEHFGAEKIHRNISRDEAIAVGAAKYALFLKREHQFIHVSLDDSIKNEYQGIETESEGVELTKQSSFTDMNIIDTPRPSYESVQQKQHIKMIDPNFSTSTICTGTIGIIDGKGLFHPLILKNHRLPFTTTYELHNTVANMEELTVVLLQGEHFDHPQNNTVISRLHITDIKPRPVGMNTFYLVLEMDKHGRLSVRVTDKETGKEMVVDDVFESMSHEEIEEKKQVLANEIQQNKEAQEMDRMKNKLINQINNLTRSKPQFREVLQDLRIRIEKAECEEELNECVRVLNTYRRE